MTHEPSQDSLLEKSKAYMQHHLVEPIEGGMSGITHKLAKSIDKATGGNIKEHTAKQALPWLAGGAAAGASFLLMEPIGKALKMPFTLAGKLFGWVGKKVPVVGGLFTGLGNLVQGIGGYIGYAAPLLLGFIGFKLFETSPNPPLPDTAKTADHHTGRKGSPSVKTEVQVHNPQTGNVEARETVPVKPDDPTPLSEKTKRDLEQVTPANKSLADVRAMRLAAIKDNNRALDLALQDYLGHVNEGYANTRIWIKDANNYNNNGPRQRLVKAMQKIGFSRAEAEAFVPEAPRLQETVHADGSDVNSDLKNFMNKFTALYGEEGPTWEKTEDGKTIFTFIDKPGDTPRTRKLSELSPTQYEEAIEKAIDYFVTRKKFFENRVTVIEHHFADIPLGFLKCGESRIPNYCDESKPWKNWRSPAEGDNNGIPWSQEHKKLQEMGAGRNIVMKPVFGLGVDTNASTEEKLRALLKAKKDQREASDKHKADLKKANETVIRDFTSAVEKMKERLAVLKEIGVATVGHYANAGQEYVQIKDCRDPECSQSVTLAFKKEGNDYRMSDWKNGLWHDGEEKGGVFYSNLTWQNPAKETVLTAAQFDSLHKGGSMLTSIVDAQPTMKKDGIRILNVTNPPADKLATVTIADTRSGETHMYRFRGTFKDGAFTAQYYMPDNLCKNDNGISRKKNAVNVGNISSAKDWCSLVDSVRHSTTARFTIVAGDDKTPSEARTSAGITGNTKIIVTERSKAFKGQVVFYGNHQGGHTFNIKGYELRAPGLPESEPGTFVRRVETLMFDDHASLAELFDEITRKASEREDYRSSALPAKTNPLSALLTHVAADAWLAPSATPTVKTPPLMNFRPGALAAAA